MCAAETAASPVPHGAAAAVSPAPASGAGMGKLIHACGVPGAATRLLRQREVERLREEFISGGYDPGRPVVVSTFEELLRLSYPKVLPPRSRRAVASLPLFLTEGVTAA